MGKLELKATSENFIETLKNDTIGRNKVLFKFVELLDSIKDNTIIALDGDWGSGKTFFVNQAKMLLNAQNELSYENDSINQLKPIIANAKCQLSQTHIAVYYDAWENDNDEDPLLSLAYNISLSIRSDYNFNWQNVSFKNVLLSLIDAITGRDIKGIKEDIQQEDFLKNISKNKKLHETIDDFFNEIITEHGNRLVIFIDELDRCKPDFAVKLLERIKHYCTDERITFVLSIHSNELRHTINKFYGENFNSSKYLNRFFDLRVNIPEPDTDKFFNSINFNREYWKIDEFINRVINRYKFSLRDTARYIRMVNIAMYKTTHSYENEILGKNAIRKFLCSLVVPVLIGLQMADGNLYNDFINGNNYKPLYEILNEEDENDLDRMYGWFLTREETFCRDSIESKKYIKFEERVELFYNRLFGIDSLNGNINSSNIYVGRLPLYQEDRRLILDVASMLSYMSDFTM